MVLIFVARWHHNYPEIVVKKVQKLAEKFVRTTSYRQLSDF